MLQASLQKLNEKLGEAAVPMERFRPNLVVAGTEAWEEDDWESFTVSGPGHGPCKFSATMPCDRCKARQSMTNDSPVTPLLSDTEFTCHPTLV